MKVYQIIAEAPKDEPPLGVSLTPSASATPTPTSVDIKRSQVLGPNGKPYFTVVDQDGKELFRGTEEQANVKRDQIQRTIKPATPKVLTPKVPTLDVDDVKKPNIPKLEDEKTVLQKIGGSVTKLFPNWLVKLGLKQVPGIVGLVVDVFNVNQELQTYVRYGLQKEKELAPQFGVGAGWVYPPTIQRREAVAESLVAALLTLLASTVTVPLASYAAGIAAASIFGGPPGWIVGSALALASMGAAYLATRAAVNQAVEHMQEIGIGKDLHDWIVNEILDEKVLVPLSYAEDIPAGLWGAAKAVVGVESIQEEASTASDYTARMNSLIKSNPKLSKQVAKGKQLYQKVKQEKASAN